MILCAPSLEYLQYYDGGQANIFKNTYKVKIKF